MSLIVVGSAAIYLPARERIVAVANTDGAFSQIVIEPKPPLRGDEVTAKAVAAVIGLELAIRSGHSEAMLTVSRALELAARISARAVIEELDDAWNTKLMTAYEALRYVQGVSSEPRTFSELQKAAAARANVLAGRITRAVTNGRAAHLGDGHAG